MATINDLSPDEFVRLMAQAVRDATVGGPATGVHGVGSSSMQGTDYKGMVAEGQKWIDHQKKINAEQRTLKDTLTGNKKAFKDFSAELNARREAIKNATLEERKAAKERNTQRENERKAAATGDTAAKNAAKLAGDEAEAKRKAIVQSKTLLTSQEKEVALLAKQDAKLTVTQNLSATMVNFGDSVMKAGIAFVQGLQAGTSGTELGTDAAAAAARATGDALSAVGDTTSALGAVMDFGSRKMQLFGKALELGGMLLSVFGKKGAEYAGEAVKTLGTEIAKTKDSYKTLTQSGAVLAGGMTEMRQEAAKAGLDVKQFSAIVSKSKEDLTFLGTGLGEAAKRLGGVSKELRNSELGIQLRKLGYSVEEQTELAASLMANQKAAGNTRAMSDLEVAKATASYGRDLKVLADLTGKDAKKEAEKARIVAMQTDLMDNMNPEELEKFQAVLKNMPDELKKGFIEKMAGGVVVDQKTNVMGQAYSEVNNTIDKAAESVRNTSVSLDEASRQSRAQNAILGEQMRQKSSGGAAIGLASTMGATGAQGYATGINALRQQTMAGKEATAKAEANATAAMNNTATLDASIAKTDEAAQKLAGLMGDALTGPITKFASTMSAGVDTLEKAFKKAGLELNPASTSEKAGSAAGQIGGGLAGGAAGFAIGEGIGAVIGGGIGSLFGGVGAIPGMAIGSTIGGWAGGALGGYYGQDAGGAGGKALGKGVDGMLQASGGGIFDGPTDGFPVMLHGTEAVVPMDNTATKQELPQASQSPSIDMSALVSTMESLISTAKDQLAKQDDMLRAMNDTKDYTERLYNAMS